MTLFYNNLIKNKFLKWEYTIQHIISVQLYKFQIQYVLLFLCNCRMKYSLDFLKCLKCDMINNLIEKDSTL